MAEIRFNYGDKFTQTTDTNTGIGSTIPAAKLDIAGGTSAGSLRVSGIATLSSYQGFVNTKLSTTEDLIVEAGKSGSVSGEVIVSTGQTITVSTGATTGQGGVQSLKVYETFMPPVGGPADRPTDVKPGMVYYNKDFKTIEFWDGNLWKQVDNTTRRGRCVWAGGYDKSGNPSSETNSIDFMNTHTLGNSKDFGDLPSAGQDAHGSGNAERGLFQGRFSGNTINYITIASEGNSIDFGDMVQARYYTASASSSTRGITMGGLAPSTPAVNTIEYVQIMTLGNALDFGDMSVGRVTDGSAFSNGVEAFCCGNHPGTEQNYEIIKIASTGNSIQGDIAPVGSTRWPGAGCANSVRGIWAGGADQSHNFTRVISYLSMASKGNAQAFGDLSKVAGGAAGAAANATRAVIPLGQHGFSPSAYNEVNTVEFITISTGGNAQDFGDLRGAENRNHTRHISPVSDSHGGLGGF